MLGFIRRSDTSPQVIESARRMEGTRMGRLSILHISKLKLSLRILACQAPMYFPQRARALEVVRILDRFWNGFLWPISF